MLTKTFTPKRTVCKVKFTLPADWAQERVALCGDFNDWDQSATELKLKNGSWTAELRLKPNSSYQFKYLCDSEWKNDDQADQYLENEFGTVNSVLVIGE
jgi:1,4-alpha-glucan branching enzyme